MPAFSDLPEDFQDWLLTDMTAAEYDGLTVDVKKTLRSHFAREQQQQQGFLDVDVLAEKLSKILNQKGPTKTAATRGREELASLRFTDSVTKVTLDHTSQPILSEEAFNKLQTDFDASDRFIPKISPREAALSALITPTVASIVDEVARETLSGLVLSNTEYIQWLPPSVTAPPNEWKKPDLLTAYPAVLISRESNGGDGVVNFRSSKVDGWGLVHRYFGGVEPDEISTDFVSSMWEGKCKLGNMHEALGEMVDYVQCVVMKDSLLSFFLYDRFGFVGGYAKRGQIIELFVNQDESIIPWNANGSKEVMKKLLKSRIPRKMRLMEKVRGAFNAIWSTSQGTSPYLGSGAHGDVYSVEVAGQKRALKISKQGHLKAEFDTLKEAHGDGAPVVQVVCDRHEDDFSAYIMDPVGSPLSNIHRPDVVSKLFTSLFTLHECGWHHGDARWQNAIEFEGRVLWCDFLSAKKPQPLVHFYRASDLQSLVESLLKSSGIDKVPSVSQIERMLTQPLTNYEEIAKFVSSNMTKGRPPRN